MRPEYPGVWAKDLIPNFAIIGNSRLGKGQGRNSLEGSGGGGGREKTIPIWTPPTTGLLVVSGPHSKDYSLLWREGKWSFITDHPTYPIWSPFTTCRVRGCLLLPRFTTGILLLDLRPEADHAFSLSGTIATWKTLVKLYMTFANNNNNNNNNVTVL